MIPILYKNAYIFFINRKLKIINKLYYTENNDNYVYRLNQSWDLLPYVVIKEENK